ncbi:MAG: diguanylate cyclase, partial [Polyangiaceae bacterium]
ARLVSGDRIQLGGSVVARFAATDQLERDLLRRLVDGSTRDPLTGAYNRAFLFERLGPELAYAQRHATKVAVLLVDLDFFKAINDTHGHGTGDEVLRAVARAMGRSVRAEDVVARLGGEEFAILARAATRLDSLRLAERVREAVAAIRLTTVSGRVVTVTISVGVARMDELAGGGTVEGLLELADTRLYRAKASGRNSVCAA